MMDYLLSGTSLDIRRTRFQLSYEFAYTSIQQNLLLDYERKVRRQFPDYSVYPISDQKSNGF